MNTFAYSASPYYISAQISLDEGDEVTWQLHALCSQLNQAGYSAYLVDAPKTDGRLWTPVLTAQQMAAQCLANVRPISIAAARTAERFPRPGLQVTFHSELTEPGAEWDHSGRLEFELPGPVSGSTVKKQLRINLPWVDAELFTSPKRETLRSGSLVFTGRLPSLNQHPLEHHRQLLDLSQHVEVPLLPVQRAKALKEAKTLYAYSKGTLTTEARLCGCEVVYIPNDYLLQTPPIHPIEIQGCFLGLDKVPIHAQQAAHAQSFASDYLAHTNTNLDSLSNFIRLTQLAAKSLSEECAWSASSKEWLDNWLPGLTLDKARQSDRFAYKQLAESYSPWSQRASLREVHADIYAEHITHGRAIGAPVHVFAHGRGMDELAATLEDLTGSWLAATEIVVHAPFSPPFPLDEEDASLTWLLEPHENHPNTTSWCGSSKWCVLIDAGTRLEPHSLLELMLNAGEGQRASVVFAAEDMLDSNGARVPFFKGNGHVEWLRHTNYLGGLVAVNTAAWLAQPNTQDYVSAYRLALTASATKGADSLFYADKVLSHAPASMPTGREKLELEVAREVLELYIPGTKVDATDILGHWSVLYEDISTAPVSLLVPTGKELGYLRSLLASVNTFGEVINDVVLLVQPIDQFATQSMLATLSPADTPMPIRIVTTEDGEYNHARTLNTGMAVATNELVLVCDDDIEFIEKNCVSQLRRLFTAADVAMAAPRLVLQVGNRPLLMSGPCVSGAGAELLPYVGEQQLLAEKGQFNRLQTPQDVAGAIGSCFMTRKSLANAIGGWDEINAALFQTVTDFGYRVIQKGWRIVWTPASNMLHAGGATLRSVRRDRKADIAHAQQALKEKEYLAEYWLAKLPTEASLYSRHFSANKAYVLDADLVVDWEPNRSERPKVLAQPISSGSGQYRVVEPLDRLQSQSLAQTCLVNPLTKKTRRVLTPMDIMRSKPDRVLLQHSIGDEDIANLKAIKASFPNTFVIQLMDDLSSDLPKSHPGHVQGQRMSHARTLEALSLSDRLLVSTQPLADYYREFCADVRVVPNALDPSYWGSFFRPAPKRERLRVGWAGAAQHQGDLKLIEEVIAALASEVDFVFMGMCPKEIRPYIKEFHSFVSYKDYPAKLCSLDLDIALAPLEDNPFNACKSNLRLLEYGAMGWPVICSDVYPFRTSSPPVTRVGANTSAWIEAIRNLMTSQSRRAERGLALNQWLHQHYLLEKQTQRWFDAIFD